MRVRFPPATASSRRRRTLEFRLDNTVTGDNSWHGSWGKALVRGDNGAAVASPCDRVDEVVDHAHAEA